MQRIHFAQYVINDIQDNGAEIISIFTGGWNYVNQGWHKTDDYGKDDWRLDVNTHWLALGLYREVRLIRGSRDFIKMPDRATKKALVAAFDRLERERKARNKAAALAEKQRKERAQWWP
jgi:hypothetical protein